MRRQPDRRAIGEYGLARAWIKLGRTHRAITSLCRALDLEPGYLDAYLALAEIYSYLRRWRDLAGLCRMALDHHRNVPEIHKFLIIALEELGSIDDAADEYMLRRVDTREIEQEEREIICCCAVRDELVRLPWFLDYYRKLGIDRFLVIDNDSKDKSREWLLGQDDVHLWSSKLPFDLANFGSSWFEILLRQYGIGHWCLIVDVDEFLLYGGAPERSLSEFCAYLDRIGKRVATGVLIDLYSDKPVAETRYESGSDPLRVCPYFDAGVYDMSVDSSGRYKDQTLYYGGSRQRVFPTAGNYLLNKAALLKYETDVVLAPGQHETNIKNPYRACGQVCLLHFKFFSTLVEKAELESERETHSDKAEHYKSYKEAFKTDPGLTLYDSRFSIRFTGTEQLQAQGILRPEIDSSDNRTVPRIGQVDMLEIERPFLSVMITVYDRPWNIGKALGSVLNQATDDMQIAVVCDFSDTATQAAVEEEISKIGDAKVEYLPVADRVGHPGIFNLCLERSTGKWVHILHDDDEVLPGFYSTMRAGLERCPNIGAAFCQGSTRAMSGHEKHPVDSWVERESAGIIDNWLERIVMENRVRFSTKLVKRSVFEKLGGFRPDAMSAFDWEMWVRIAAHYPVYYEPESLVEVSRGPSTESSRLKQSGEQVAHAFTALELAKDHLTADRADILVRKARDRISLNALDAAERFIAQGDLESGLSNIREVASHYPSSKVKRRIIDVIQGNDFRFHG